MPPNAGASIGLDVAGGGQELEAEGEPEPRVDERRVGRPGSWPGARWARSARGGRRRPGAPPARTRRSLRGRPRRAPRRPSRSRRRRRRRRGSRRRLRPPGSAPRSPSISGRSGSAARWRRVPIGQEGRGRAHGSPPKMGGSRASAWPRDDTVPLMPKTLTGAELDLDDAPARDSDLFIVDGNNLAYRAFFALPEELVTTDGQPTNALLGFTNMLFKLLADYRPKGVAVAWDSRPGASRGRRRGGGRRLQGRPQADAGPAARAVPALPADRRGVRLPQPGVRGLGGRRRDRDARHARGRRGPEDVRRLDRPRRVPALQREHLADDDAARRRGRQRLHARARRGALRHHARSRFPTSSA